jgi:hypothetical protein
MSLLICRMVQALITQVKVVYGRESFLARFRLTKKAGPSAGVVLLIVGILSWRCSFVPVLAGKRLDGG